MSKKLQNEYKVVIEEESESKARSSVDLLATDEAFKAYENVLYPLLIEIRDGDQTLETIPLKTIIYNFPAEYVRSGQIKLANPATAKTREVKIELVPFATPHPSDITHNRFYSYSGTLQELHSLIYPVLMFFLCCSVYSVVKYFLFSRRTAAVFQPSSMPPGKEQSRRPSPAGYFDSRQISFR